VNAKVHEWLHAGTSQVWVIDPQTKSVMVYRSAREVAALTEADTLSAPDLLPGFALPVVEIFE
jgi:Uma2 family endonuclease